MSQGLTLLAGALLAVGALAFVLYPLFFDVRETRRAPRPESPSDDSAIVALREIEFDKATGKLSEADYAELKTSYSARALKELRQRERDVAASRPEPSTGHPERSEESAVPSDPIEARVREYRETHRACPTCGVRPEPDAVYCSTCGGYLDQVCPSCSAPITEPSAAFCSRCGLPLAPGAFVHR